MTHNNRGFVQADFTSLKHIADHFGGQVVQSVQCVCAVCVCRR